MDSTQKMRLGFYLASSFHKSKIKELHMLNLRFLYFVVSVISFSTISPVYSIRTTTLLNHKFFEFDKNDKSFEEYFDTRYANLPKCSFRSNFRNVYKKPDIELFRCSNMVNVRKQDLQQREVYQVSYSFEIGDHDKKCTVSGLRGYLYTDTGWAILNNLEKIDLFIFLFPFMHYEGIKELVIQPYEAYSLDLIRPGFNPADERNLRKIGFESCFGVLERSNGDLVITRQAATEYLEKVKSGGRT